MKYSNIVLLQNKVTDPKNVLRYRVEGFFKDKNHPMHTVTLDKNTDVSSDMVPFTPDLVIVLGGDGTFLRAVQAWAPDKSAIVGINTGHLGFLTRIDSTKLEEFLESIWTDNFNIAPKMMLEIVDKKCIALNDVVIKNSDPGKMTKINVSIDDEFLIEYDADGLILSTPTGSTGYNLSCTGPIIDPRTNVIAVTPICPHSLTAKPIILSSTHKITVESADSNVNPLVVSVDGSNVLQLNANDKIDIIESSNKLQFISFEEGTFYKLLKNKLGWGINLRTVAYENRKS
jgi:NAD+ kinase